MLPEKILLGDWLKWYCPHVMQGGGKMVSDGSEIGDAAGNLAPMESCGECGRNVCLEKCSRVRVGDVESLIRGRVRILKRYCLQCL